MCKERELSDQENKFSFPPLLISLHKGKFHLAAKPGMVISNVVGQMQSDLEINEDTDITLGGTKDMAGTYIYDKNDWVGYKVIEANEEQILVDRDIYLNYPINIHFGNHNFSVSLDGDFFTISVNNKTERIKRSEISSKTFKLDENLAFTIEKRIHLTEKNHKQSL